MNTEKAELFTPAPEWSGRSDGPGPEHARWHSVINQSAACPAPVTLLGFASDEGVLRNGGRQGAAAGPAALRSALGSLAVHHEHALADAGTITTQADDLEGAHDALSEKVQELVAAGSLPIILGGGHETAFGSHRGLYRAVGATKIINLDAHFDLRRADRATSGTPFKQ
ncbi:arginase family protein, partial [Corynebacterium striatum]